VLIIEAEYCDTQSQEAHSAAEYPAAGEDWDDLGSLVSGGYYGGRWHDRVGEISADVLMTNNVKSGT
jgi:hypothetical protein